MGTRWAPLPPLRRGLLTSPVRELWARRLVERRWDEHLSAGAEARTARTPVTAGLFISLTSHTPRFATLALTLKSLLLQDVRPEHVLLWIGHRDMAALPDEVAAMAGHGLMIRPCEDHRSHTKYVHALREHGSARVAICDDDTYYHSGWLGELIAADRPGEIPCHRIHRITLDERGLPERYRLWDHDSAAEDASPLNYPTGVGGMLLRADRFDPRLFDMDAAQRLCPTQDDLWLYWMARLAGTRFRRSGYYEPLTVWRTSQDVALWRVNNGGEQATDRQVDAMIHSFGVEGMFE
jgi:hypothetical protein